MSFFQILVCIFLCVYSQVPDISYESPIDLSSISMVSRWTSGYASLNRQLLRASYEDLLSKRETAMDLKRQYLEIEKQIEPLFAYQKLFMAAIQNGDNSLIDQSEALEELCRKRDALKSALIENSIQNDHARLVHHKALKNLRNADIIQECLQKQAGYMDELQSEGAFNADHAIRDMDDIPVYGSIDNNNFYSDIACLLDGPLDIDSTSDFWLWPISNGMISAGTWSYPRRCHALGIGYSCRYVQ